MEVRKLRSAPAPETSNAAEQLLVDRLATLAEARTHALAERLYQHASTFGERLQAIHMYTECAVMIIESARRRS